MSCMYSVQLPHASGCNTDMTDTYANTHFDSTCKRTKLWEGNGNLHLFLGLAPQHVWIFFWQWVLTVVKLLVFHASLASSCHLYQQQQPIGQAIFKIKFQSKKESYFFEAFFFPSMLLLFSQMTHNLQGIFSRSCDYRFHLSSRSLALPRAIIVLQVFWSKFSCNLNYPDRFVVGHTPI